MTQAPRIENRGLENGKTPTMNVHMHKKYDLCVRPCMYRTYLPGGTVGYPAHPRLIRQSFRHATCYYVIVCCHWTGKTQESHDFYKNHYIQIHFEKYLTTIRDNLRFSNNISPNLLGLDNFPQKT